MWNTPAVEESLQDDFSLVIHGEMEVQWITPEEEDTLEQSYHRPGGIVASAYDSDVQHLALV